jgi:hypothetical protein
MKQKQCIDKVSNAFRDAAKKYAIKQSRDINQITNQRPKSLRRRRSEDSYDTFENQRSAVDAIGSQNTFEDPFDNQERLDSTESLSTTREQLSTGNTKIPVECRNDPDVFQTRSRPNAAFLPLDTTSALVSRQRYKIVNADAQQQPVMETDALKPQMENTLQLNGVDSHNHLKYNEEENHSFNFVNIDDTMDTIKVKQFPKNPMEVVDSSCVKTLTNNNGPITGVSNNDEISSEDMKHRALKPSTFIVNDQEIENKNHKKSEDIESDSSTDSFLNAIHDTLGPLKLEDHVIAMQFSKKHFLSFSW